MFTEYVINNKEMYIEVSHYGIEPQRFYIEIDNKSIRVANNLIVIHRKPWIHFQDPYRVDILESELMVALRSFDSKDALEKRLGIKFVYSPTEQSNDMYKFAHEVAVFTVREFNRKRKEERKKRMEEQRVAEQKKRNEQKKEEQKKHLPMLLRHF